MLFQLVHTVGNRERWQTSSTVSEASAAVLADEISRIKDVDGVRVSSRTGNIVVTFATCAGRKAFHKYIEKLSSNPPSKRWSEERRTHTARILANREASRVKALRENRFVTMAEDCYKRAVIKMPVIEAVKRIFGKGSTPGGDDLDFSPLVRWTAVRPLLPMGMRIANALLGSIPYLFKGIKALFSGHMTVEVLDAAAIGISLLRRDFRTAGLVILLLGMGEMLEHYTRKKSLASLADQLSLRVDKVWVRRGNAVIEVPLKDTDETDVIVVRAGSTIPVDGKVVAGNASVNQATMTGEPLPVLRSEGGTVFAGTVVEDGEIDIMATGRGDATRLNQIVKFIETSEKTKAGIQGKADHLADAIVPFNFLIAGLVWLFTRNLTRTASVLLVDYSCALRLATPLSILTSMREGTRRGMVVKGGRYLEALSEVDCVVFDKTGTLTQASPKLSDIVPVNTKLSEDELLCLAACLEEHFPHPVSRAIVRAADEKGLDHLKEAHDSKIEYVVAHGIASRVRRSKVVLGSRHFVEDDEKIDVSGAQDEVSRLADEGKSVLYMAIGGKLVGLIGIIDPLRPEVKETVEKLREAGVRHIVMLTGDEEKTARNVARQLGIDDYRAQVLPTDKAKHVEELKKQGYKVLMVGDGINDSPALSCADVGMTLSDGSAIAQEVADVVLTGATLSDLPVAIELGRRTMGRIKKNFFYSVSLNSVFMAGGIFGLLMPAAGAVLHNLTTIGVCLNAMRSPFSEASTPMGYASDIRYALTETSRRFTGNIEDAAEQLAGEE